MSMFHYYDLGYAEAFIFDEFLVNQIKEGTLVTVDHNRKLAEVLDRHFKNKPVVYISNRIFSYAVDPITYLETSKIHNLLAMAIVTDNEVYRSNALLEKKFYKKDFAVFKTLSEAVGWSHNVILNQAD